MRLVSLLGLTVLLLLTFLMSYHHRRVRLRTVLWGLSLQFLFATIILNRNDWSFRGMAVLGCLLIAYIWSDAGAGKSFPWVRMSLMCLAALGLGSLLVLPQMSVPYIPILISVIAALFLNGLFFRNSRLQLALASLLIVVGISGLIDSGTYGQEIFARFSTGVTSFLGLSDYGARFLFGNLADREYFFPATDTWPGFGFQFAFKVLPTIIFFGAFMSILYYLGIMQKIIVTIARFMQWTLGTSGAETLSCTANIFVGQTEAPLLIKPFLEQMTVSELLTVMVGGFATIAGGVLAGYVAMGIDAGNLIAASVMAAPAALVIGKIICPETGSSVTAGNVEIPKIQPAENILDAASVGISDGLKLAVNVGAMLVGFIALIAVVDVMLNGLDYWIDGVWRQGALRAYADTAGFSPVKQEYAGVFPGSLKTLFGTILRPLAWVMGVPWKDADKVGNLLGIKLSLNEFVAYGALASYADADAISPRAEVIATYALCGFANFSSIGIQIGGIGAVAPRRRRDLSRIALRHVRGRHRQLHDGLHRGAILRRCRGRAGGGQPRPRHAAGGRTWIPRARRPKRDANATCDSRAPTRRTGAVRSMALGLGIVEQLSPTVSPDHFAIRGTIEDNGSTN